MSSKLEKIGINERSGLVTPNLYKQNWNKPNDTSENYSASHTRALSDATTPIYGKGTGVFLDTDNGGGEYDINGNQIDFPNSGRQPLMNYNYTTWSVGPNNVYNPQHPNALGPSTIPPVGALLSDNIDSRGKGTKDLTLLNTSNSYVLPAHTNYNGGNWNDIISRNNNINNPDNYYRVNTSKPLDDKNWYNTKHPNATSDGDVKGKGTNQFLDTDNGGGFYDIVGNQADYPKSGREEAIATNILNWSYGPTAPYSETNTRALSDNKTPIYGKGTGKFLDTANGGGDYDINGNPNILNSGRKNAISLNTSQWSYGPSAPYSETNTRALSDNKTPIYGKGTNQFLDTDNGGGFYDIVGNQTDYPKSGREEAIATNILNWSYGPTAPYSETNSRALSDGKTPIYGKGTGKFLDTSNGGGDYDINGNPNILNSGRKNAILINTSQWSYGPSAPYSVTNTRALSDTTTPIYGKGTGIFLGTDKGGGFYDIAGNQTDFPKSGRDSALLTNLFTYGFNDIKNYGVNHPNAKRPDTIPTSTDIKDLDIFGIQDNHGKGTGDSNTLDAVNSYVLAAHINYNGGSWNDILTRNFNISIANNIYRVNPKDPLNLNDFNSYNVDHVNALRPFITPKYGELLTDITNTQYSKGKGTRSGVLLSPLNSFVLPAHTDYRGGSWDDIVSRNNNINNPYNTYKINVNDTNDDKDWYNLKHSNATSNGDVKGKGTNQFLDTDNGGGLYDIDGNQTDYPDSGRDKAISKNTLLYGTGPTNEYKTTHPNALANLDEQGKGTGIYLDTTNGGGLYDVIGRKNSVTSNVYQYNYSQPSNKTKWYTINHPNALGPKEIPISSDLNFLDKGDVNGKGTGDSNTLDAVNSYVLAAHINYNGGNWNDIIARNYNISSINNIYRVNPKDPLNTNDTNSYNMSHPNALYSGLIGDAKGKGTGDGIADDGTYAAHTNYNGGSYYDNLSRNNASTINAKFTKKDGNKPFGYGYDIYGDDYITNKPICISDKNDVNIGKYIPFV